MLEAEARKGQPFHARNFATSSIGSGQQSLNPKSLRGKRKSIFSSISIQDQFPELPVRFGLSRGSHKQAEHPAEFQCVVCFDSLPRSAFPIDSITPSCAHPRTDICIQCIQRSLAAQFSDTLWSEISCPLCHVPLSYFDMRRCAPPDLWERYDRIVNRLAMQEIEGFTWCPVANCRAGQIHECGQEDPVVACILCHERHCFTHGGKWHEGLTCQEVDDPKLAQKRRLAEEARLRAEEEKNMNREEDRLVILKAQKLREKMESDKKARRAEEQLGEIEVMSSTLRCPTPSCKYRAEKDLSCKHVTCTYCKFEFCWVCREKWVTGHLSVNCVMSDEEKRKAAESEERDMIEESKRIAIEEQESRDEIERTLYEVGQRNGKWDPNSPHERERARRRREERLEEIEDLISSQQCPGPGCLFWIYKAGTSNQIICIQCGHEFCWVCRSPWQPGELHNGDHYGLGESTQLRRVLEISKLEEERRVLLEEEKHDRKIRVKVKSLRHPEEIPRESAETRLEELLREMKGLKTSKKCPGYGCGLRVRNLLRIGNLVTCPGCGVDFCFKCSAIRSTDHSCFSFKAIYSSWREISNETARVRSEISSVELEIERRNRVTCWAVEYVPE